ncbi:MAG: polysaccharide biosynthesis protein [Clostridiales bacterium]|nr:polysaccharide biosynthesis protein [Clostridiales bacterium]
MRIKKQQLVLVFIDILCVVAAFFAATVLRFEGFSRVPANELSVMAYHFAIACAAFVIPGIVLGGYNVLWSYMGFSDVLRQLLCSLFSAGVLLVLRYLHILMPISGSIVCIYLVIVFLMTSLVRALPRIIHWGKAWGSSYARKKVKRVLVIGAGDTGAMIIKKLSEDTEDKTFPVVAIDDDPSKRMLRIAGVLVAGTTDDIPKVASKYRVSDAIVAIPSLTTEEMKKIYYLCNKAGITLKMFGKSEDMDSFLKGNKDALKNVRIEDLLFRESIKTDMSAVYNLLEGKSVLVTGGAGSIGSEICRQVLAHGCRKLIIFDFNENGLFEINEELKHKHDPHMYELCLGSIRDKARLEAVFSKYLPDIVFHAAAHKHVPMMELNPFEAIKNNVAGTRNVLDCCEKYSTKRFLLISTDKAVNPTNVMGATKRIAELLVQSRKNTSSCIVSAVRFGNVLGSNGSVIPTFRRQIEQGGPVTVTHRDIQRYFMTIPEAVSLVLSAGTLAQSGELFVLDMGKPVKIYDLAEYMIRIAGYEPNKDIEIKITGLRPGEKLFEELVLNNETVDSTSHEKIFVMHADRLDTDLFKKNIEDLVQIAIDAKDENLLRKTLFDTVRASSQDNPEA